MAPYADVIGQLLPKDSRQTKFPNYTPLAKKYSHPVNTSSKVSHRVIKNTGKSGLTPLSPFRPSAAAKLRKAQLHYYQKKRFYGFSAAELQKLEVLSDCLLIEQPTGSNEAIVEGGLGSYTLNNPIHAMFEKTKWESRAEMPRHLGPIPIRGDFTGRGEYWLAENDRVWRAMRPALRLASRFLTHASTYPWWDAFLNIEGYRDVSRDRLICTYDHDKHLKTFHIRPSLKRLSQAEIETKLRYFGQRIRFRLASGYTNTQSGLPIRDRHICGSTQPDALSGFIRVDMSIEMVQPLLGGLLQGPELITQLFRVASVLVHETAHAIGFAMQELSPSPLTYEPYFEDEPLCEVGWSLEDKIFGGEAVDLIDNEYARGGPGLPSCGVFSTNWFRDVHQGHGPYGGPTLKGKNWYRTHYGDSEEEDPFHAYSFYPIPISWAHSLFQHQFWELKVRNLGANATQMGPKTLGTLYTIKHPEGKQVSFPDLHDAFTHRYTVIDSSMSTKKLMKIHAANEKKEHIRKLIWKLDTIRPTNDPEDPGNPALDLEPDEQLPAMEVPPCPRYKEICEYLFKQRGPLELALDSMDFDISEPTFLKYIQQRGGLSITPAELRAFLLNCNDRRELFLYYPFPGVGTVTRIPLGWPRATHPHLEIPLTSRPAFNQKAVFEQAMHDDPSFKSDLYDELGEFRDIDMHSLHRILSARLTVDYKMKAEDLEDVVNEISRLHWEEDDPLEFKKLTMGPEGIVRLQFSVAEAQKGSKSRTDFTRKRALDRERDIGMACGVWSAVDEIVYDASMAEINGDLVQSGDEDDEFDHLEDMGFD